jgi:aminoglycoside 6-adenylyltransferase
MKKRDEKTILDLILHVAKNDENIRAVIMNGSRASPFAAKDEFQDFDIVYIVNEVVLLVESREWLKEFGELLIMQTPDEMDGIWPDSKNRFAFLMLFNDGNRIDLTLIQQEKFENSPRDSQSILLLDKDLKLHEFKRPSDKDYLPKQPTEKEFKNCCNEFLWVSTYVAKGIARKQLTYAKAMAEQNVKEQLIKLLTWYAATKTHFQKSMGAYGKYLEQYLEPNVWDKFCKTYVDANYTHMWEGLFIMCELFDEIAIKISEHYHYPYDQDEYRAVVKYLKDIRKMISDR